MFTVEFTFEDDSSYRLPPNGDTLIEGSWDHPPVGRHAEFVASLVDDFIQTDIGNCLIYSCGDIVRVTVTEMEVL